MCCEPPTRPAGMGKPKVYGRGLSSLVCYRLQGARRLTSTSREDKILKCD